MDNKQRFSANKKITNMEVGGKILGEVLAELLAMVKPGVTELEIDKRAEQLILEKGGLPGFKRVTGYSNTICISVNDIVVHGIPTKRVLKVGDVVGIDCGVYYGGYHTDMAETVKISNIKYKISNRKKDEVDTFLEIGKKALYEGIKQAKVGNRVGHISSAIQKIVEAGGYSVVRSLVGHGVGRELHEEPEIPGFLDRQIEDTPLLTHGMTIAVEVIYNMGKPDVEYVGGDNWSIGTADKSLSGLFERTLLVTENGNTLITELPF